MMDGLMMKLGLNSHTLYHFRLSTRYQSKFLKMDFLFLSFLSFSNEQNEYDSS